MKQVKDVMTQGFIGVGPDSSVANAVDLMRERGIGAVAIADGKQALGIFTERDLITKVLTRAGSVDLSRIKIKDVMTREIVSVGPLEPYEGLVKLMKERRIRHLLVLDGGEIVGVVSIRDVIFHYVEDLTRAHAELKDSVLRLMQVEKLTAMGELTAGVAHELNQPLNVTKIILQGILRDIEKGRFSEEEAKQELPEILIQMNRAAEIIDHMCSFSRRSIGSSRETCDLNLAIRSVLRFVTQQFKAHDIELVETLDPRLPAVFVDRMQIEQVCLNLLSNARHAVENSGKSERRIEIRTSLGPEGKAVVEVVDNGCGIPEAIHSKIFQQFFTTKEPGKGTGLGLALCRKIVEDHNGTIEFDSREGEGTCMRVKLPVIQ